MATTKEQPRGSDTDTPETMKAVVAYAPHDYRLEERPVPAAGPDNVLVRVEACGVCASDVKTFKGAETLWGGGGNPAWIQAPVVPGHEFLGHVAAIGERAAETRGLRVGDRVIAEQIVPCWECRYCRRGQYWMCQVHNIFGFQQ